MKHVFLAVVAVLSLAVPGCVTQPAQPQSQFAAQRQLVHLIARPTQDAFGSGVMIAPNRMLTAAHVVDGEGPIVVDGKQARVLKIDKAHDLALLEVDLPGGVKIARERPALDTPVLTIGFPAAVAEILTEGRVQAYGFLDKRYQHYVVLSSPIWPGNSGGGIFAFLDGEWELVGILSAGYQDCSSGPFSCQKVEHISFAVEVNTINAFLQGT